MNFAKFHTVLSISPPRTPSKPKMKFAAYCLAALLASVNAFAPTAFSPKTGVGPLHATAEATKAFSKLPASVKVGKEGESA